MVKALCSRCGELFDVDFQSHANRRKICSKKCPVPVLPRLVEKTNIVGDCWLFESQIQESGHAKIGYFNRSEFVHRVSWMELKGEIPSGQCILHKCVGTPNCWNPNHLYIGDKQNNADDRGRQGRTALHRGNENGRAKLNEKEVIEIRGNRCGFMVSQIAEMYGVSVSVIEKIRSGITWMHV